jgi:hypothetical protein
VLQRTKQEDEDSEAKVEEFLSACTVSQSGILIDVTRPEKSLHLSSENPMTNLHYPYRAF